MGEKLKLYGFNNLTKALSFNIYDVCYAKTAREHRRTARLGLRPPVGCDEDSFRALR